jgi:hypothetical protein
MGRVWLGHDEVLHRDVAVKEIVLPFGLGDDEREDMRLRTLREARAAARLNHPNVVQIYDVVHGEEQPWIVMEYVRSRSLLQMLKDQGPLDEEPVAGIGLAILSALDAANRAGVLHRDVKPSNVLIADDGRVVLTDFGSALVDENEGAITRSGVILGAPQYIAPERARSGVSTPESDLWSLGATLYTAVEGRAPYARPTALATLIALATERPDPMLRAHALRPVLHGLLLKNPKSRMGAKEAEQRLSRIADVQTTVQLRRVPTQRKAIESAEARVGVNGAGGNGVASHRAGGNVTGGNGAGGSGAGGSGAGGNGAGGNGAGSNGVPAEVGAPRNEPSTGLYAAPFPVPRPAPAPPRVRLETALRSRRGRWTAVGAGVAVLIAAGGAAFAADHAGRTTTTPRTVATGAATGAAPATTASAPVAVTRPPVADPDMLPPGAAWWYDDTGFRIGYPAGWRIIEQSRGSVAFCEPGIPRILKVHGWNRVDSDFVTAMVHEESNAGLANYRKIRMEALPTGDGAEWEYTFSDPKMGPLHAVSRGFVVNGQPYMIQWLTPPNDWQAFLGNYPKLVKTFQPPRRPAAHTL